MTSLLAAVRERILTRRYGPVMDRIRTVRQPPEYTIADCNVVREYRAPDGSVWLAPLGTPPPVYGERVPDGWHYISRGEADDVTDAGGR